MKIEETDLRERYAGLSEYELADILRTGDLTDTAKKCLNDELRVRGINSIDAEVDELNKIDEELEKRIQEDLKKGKESIKRFSKPFYITGTVFLFIGVALYLYSVLDHLTMSSSISGTSKEEQLGLVAISLGCMLFILAWVRATTKLVYLKFMLRKEMQK